MLIASIIMFVISLAIALTQKPKTQPPQDQALTVNTAAAGRAIPDVIGTVTLKGANTVWYGDLSSSPVKTKSGK